jgi:hypothetical protein
LPHHWIGELWGAKRKRKRTEKEKGKDVIRDKVRKQKQKV